MVLENLFVDKFGLGKSVSEKPVSENLLSEKSPRPGFHIALKKLMSYSYLKMSPNNKSIIKQILERGEHTFC